MRLAREGALPGDVEVVTMPRITGRTVGVAALIFAGGILPVAFYWLLLGRLPTLMAAQALTVLNQSGPRAALVDVRPAADFERLHVEGALNWPLADVLAATPAQVPAAYQGKTLLLICNGGLASAQAVLHLQAIGISNVFNIRGGMQEWAKASWRHPTMAFTRMVQDGQTQPATFEPLSQTDQAAQAASFLIVKPLYMLLSLALAALLLRETMPDMAAVRWSMLFFFIGEVFCYINILALGDDSYLSEYLHSFGMVAGFGFVFYALLQGLDMRVVRLGAVRWCALYPLCETCTLAEGRTCKAWRVAQLLIPVLALLCAMPLVARFDLSGQPGPVFGFPFYLTRFGIYQVYENRLLPLLALLCFAAAYVPLWLPVREPFPTLTLILVSAGGGALVFSLGRLALGMMYATNLVWFNAWEEVTELAFVVAVGAVLWVFRSALLAQTWSRLKLALARI